MSDLPLRIIPVPFYDIGQLLKNLEALTRTVSPLDLDSLAAKGWEAERAQPKSQFCLALVVNTTERLMRELAACQQSVRAFWDSGREWRTPAGSCLAANPLGPTGRLAFVYPGIASFYPGFGQSLLTEFSETRRHLEQLIGRDPVEATNVQSLTHEQAEKLFSDAIELGELGVLLAYAYTHVLRNRFRVQPTMALGYSLGEISMFASLGTWQHPEQLLERIRNWTDFRTCVNLRTEQHAAKSSDWQTVVLNAAADHVRQAMAGTTDLFLTHINTSQEVVVLGRAASLNELRDRLACPVVEQPVAFAFHAEPLQPLRDGIRNVYSLDVASRPGIDFVSQSPYLKVPHHSRAVAECLANTLCGAVDFPQIVETAYAGNARLFLTIGPRASCSTWIDTILRDRPHVAIPIDHPGASTADGLTRALARLLTHRVEFVFEVDQQP